MNLLVELLVLGRRVPAVAGERPVGGCDMGPDCGAVTDPDRDAVLARRPSAVCEPRDTPLGTQYRIRLVLLNKRYPGPWLTEKWYGTEAAAWGAALRCIRSPNRDVE